MMVRQYRIRKSMLFPLVADEMTMVEFLHNASSPPSIRSYTPSCMRRQHFKKCCRTSCSQLWYLCEVNNVCNWRFRVCLKTVMELYYINSLGFLFFPILFLFLFFDIKLTLFIWWHAACISIDTYGCLQREWKWFSTVWDVVVRMKNSALSRKFFVWIDSLVSVKRSLYSMPVSVWVCVSGLSRSISQIVPT